MPKFWTVYDEESGKSIDIEADSLAKAIETSEHVDFSTIKDGAIVPLGLGPGDHAVDAMDDIARAYRAISPGALLYVENTDALKYLGRAREGLFDAFEALKSTALEHGAASIDADTLNSWEVDGHDH